MKNKKNIISTIIFIVFIILTFYIIFRDANINEIIKNIKSANIFYIFLACLSMCVFVLGEGINIRRVLVNLGNKVSIIQSIKYASCGFFFSSITPSSSGGQPAQIYFMSKDNLKISHSALALLVELCIYQVVTCMLGILGFIINYDILINNIGNIKYLVIIGLTLNVVVLLSLIFIIFSKTITIKFINIIHNLLIKIKYKKEKEFYKKAINQVEEYHKCSIYLKNNKIIFIKIFMTTLIKLLLYHSIPYLIYLSFNLHEYNIITFIFMESVLYVSVSCIPLPGSVGVSEGGFLTMFKTFFPSSILSSAMLISRGISFYLFLIITGLVILSFKFYETLKHTK